MNRPPNAEGGLQGTRLGDPSPARSPWFAGKSWAYAETTPFRRFKPFNHEGGSATPLSVQWAAAFPQIEEE